MLWTFLWLYVSGVASVGIYCRVGYGQYTGEKKGRHCKQAVSPNHSSHSFHHPSSWSKNTTTLL